MICFLSVTTTLISTEYVYTYVIMIKDPSLPPPPPHHIYLGYETLLLSTLNSPMYLPCDVPTPHCYHHHFWQLKNPH